MKFKFISPQDPEYSQSLMLRWEEVQKPLGLPPGSQCGAYEHHSFHLLAIEGAKVVGCLLFSPESDYKGRIDQVALSEEYDGGRFGRRFLSYLERTLCQKGFREIYLRVMPHNISFYQRLGYQPCGDEIDNMGHNVQEMRKYI